MNSLWVINTIRPSLPCHAPFFLVIHLSFFFLVTHLSSLSYTFLSSSLSCAFLSSSLSCTFLPCHACLFFETVCKHWITTLLVVTLSNVTKQGTTSTCCSPRSRNWASLSHVRIWIVLLQAHVVETERTLVTCVTYVTVTEAVALQESSI